MTSLGFWRRFLHLRLFDGWFCFGLIVYTMIYRSIKAFYALLLSYWDYETFNLLRFGCIWYMCVVKDDASRWRVTRIDARLGHNSSWFSTLPLNWTLLLLRDSFVLSLVSVFLHICWSFSFPVSVTSDADFTCAFTYQKHWVRVNQTLHLSDLSELEYRLIRPYISSAHCLHS